MLVLSRKVGEEIIIDGDIRLTVTAIGDGRIKIGITAPPHVRVDRAEVAERIRQFAETETPAAEPKPQLTNRLPATLPPAQPAAATGTATRLRLRRRV